MSSGFNLTAQLHLQAPTNTQQVVGQIQSGLGKISIPVQIQADPKALGGLNSQLKTTQKTALATGKNMAFLNRNIAEAARRFSVITVATGSFIALARGIKNSVKAAIEFERELIKISQVTGKNVSELRSLTSEVTSLSTGLGVANQTLLETARVLSQAGLSATKTKQAMEVLANTTLAPSFDNIIDTTEGAIAILNQFGREAKKTGQDIKFLEQSLDAINQVSKNFAVESADLITAIRRVGGVFEAAGGSLNELIALFTSVRQTTRESAETIATGFRTIFTRLQRSETVDALKELGIALTDTEGKFIGPLKAIEALSIGLAGLDTKDVRFNEIVEQLGGFRQIGKVIPLLKQYNVAQQALAVANESAGSTANDAQTAQQSLAVQFQKVTQQFDALIRKFSDSETFRGLAKTVIDLATAFLKFAESLENVLPQLTALAAIKIGKNIAPGILGLLGGGRGARKNMGGRIHGYAQGGWVPGTGSRDTVPAMLTPGEFVIKKGSAAKLGSDTLSDMNAKGYASGGKVSSFRNAYGVKKPVTGSFDKPVAGQIAPGGTTQFATLGSSAGDARDAVLQVVRAGDKKPNNAVDAGGAFLQPVGIERNLRADIPGQDLKADLKAKIVSKYKGDKDYINKAVDALPASSLDVPVMIESGGFSQVASDTFKTEIAKGIGDGAAKAVPDAMAGQFKRGKFDSALQSANIEQIEGNIFESLLAGLSEKPFGDTKVNANDNWDFASGVGAGLGKLFGIDADVSADAKRTFSDDSISSIVKKAGVQFKEEQGDKLAKALALELKPEKQKEKKDTSRTKIAKAQKQAAERKNMGGSISGSSDSVPALLTPGEFVVKKSAAQSIGYSNLSSMNQTGVAKFAKGGAVGVQRFGIGGGVLQQTAITASDPLADMRAQTQLTNKDMAMLGQAAKINASAFKTLVGQLQGIDIDSAEAALKYFARNMNATADEAEILAGAQQAAIDSARGYASAPGPPQAPGPSKGVAGQSESRVMPSRTGDEMAEITQKADALAQDFDHMGEATRAGQKAAMAYRDALLGGASEMSAYYQGLEAGQKYQEELEAESQNLKEAYARGIITEEELNAAGEALAQKRKAAKVGGPSEGPGGGRRPTREKKSMGELKDMEKSSRALSETFNKAGRALNGLSNAAVGAMFIMGSLTESSSGLSEEQKKITQAGNNAMAMHLAMATQIGSLVLETASAIMASRANSAAKRAESLAATMAGTAEDKLSSSAIAAALALDKLSGSAGGKQASDAVEDVDLDAGAPGGKKGVGPGGKFAKTGKANMAMAAFAGAMAVTTIVTGYYAKKTAEAVAALDIFIDKSNQAGDAELEKIGQVGAVASESKFVKSREDAATGEIDKGIVAKTGAHNQTVAMIAGTAAGVVAAGVAMTTGFAAATASIALAANVVPIAGQIVSAVLLGVALAAIAIGAALAIFGKSAEDEAKKQSKLRKLAAKASRGFATTTFRAQKAVSDFDQSLQQAKEAGLSLSQQLSLAAISTGDLGRELDAGNARMKTATQDRVDLENSLKNEGLLGRDTGNVTAAGEEATGDDRERLGQLEQLRKQEEEARSSQNKLLKKYMAQENSLRSQINKTLAGTINEVSKEAPEALADFTGYDSLKALAAGADATSVKFQLMIKAVNDAQGEFEDIAAKRYGAKIEAASDELNFKLVKAYQKEYEATIAQQIAQQKKFVDEQAVAHQKSILARVTEELVIRRMKDIIDRNNSALAAFNDVLLGATATAANFSQIDDIGSMEGGFGAAQIDTSALDQPLAQVSKKLLEATVGRGQINTAETGGPAFKGAGEIGKRIIEAKALIDEIPGVFNHFKLTFDKNVTGATATLFTNLEAAAGIAPGTLAGTDIGDMIQKRISSMIEGGQKIDADTYQAIIDDIEEALDADLETIKRAIEIQNQFLDKMNTVNQAVVAQQQRVAEATARVVDVQERAADRMAQATGKPRRRQDKEAGRIRAANIRLGGAKTKFGAEAGNVDKTFNAAVAARDAARTARKDEKKEAGTAVVGGPQLTGPDGLVALNMAANEGAQAFKNAKAELERMADQSARAGDIMADITKEQKGRDQLKQLGNNIAFGSDDQRKDIARGFTDLQTAMGQGGIQNANDGERARILKTLDSVADVRIGPVDPATGEKMTGRQIKAKMASDEVMRLTGNATVAAAAGEQVMLGSKEEQLLQELATLGEQEAEAAAKLKELADTELGYLEKIAANTAKMFGPNVKKALDENRPPAKTTAENAVQNDLEEKRKKALEKLTEANVNLTASTEALRLSNVALFEAQKETKETEKLSPEESRVRQAEFAATDEGQVIAGLENIAGMFDASANADAGGSDFLNAVEQGAKVEARIEGTDADAKLKERGFGLGSGGNGKFSTDIIQENWTGNNSEVGDMDDEQLRRSVTATLENAFKLAMAGDAFDVTDAESDKISAAKQATIEAAILKIQDSGQVDMQSMGAHFAAALNQEFIPAVKEVLKPSEELRRLPDHEVGLARGGLVYRSVGGSIFEPRGTDTVPAMLTPGEFVVRKAAVDRIGMRALTAMNNGDTSAVYKATGGGVGYNKSLNRNRIAGFHRGGMAGKGNTSYASSQGNGGGLQLDPSSIQSVLNEFNANFGSHIDNMIANLGTFAEAATSLATTITNGMDVRIVMSGNLTTAVKLDGDQTEHLKNAIADSILPKIAENVAGTIEDKIRQLKDNP
jgi:hypothetical protein